MAELTIILRTHHFVCRRISARARVAVESFARKNVQYRMVKQGYRFVRMPVKVFAAATEDRAEFRFHINQVQEFKEHLKNDSLGDAQVEWVTEPMFSIIPVTLPVFPQWTTREEQVPAVEYLANPGVPRLKLLALQTGAGKSYITLRVISDKGVLTIIIVKPGYIEKWLIDIQKTYDIAVEDVIVVRGSKDLMGLLELGLDTDAKMIMMSNRTLLNWIKLYEKFGRATMDDLGYACLPDEMFKHLGAGGRLIDEVHQDFHFNFKMDLYTHCEYSYSLSATLIADDPFLNRMYEMAYPTALQFKGAAYKKYIASKAVFYKLKHPDRARYREPSTKNYSHNYYEQYLLKSESLKKGYLELIDRCIRGTYIRNFKPGDRLVIFCASISFCTVLTEYLKKIYHNLDVRRYVEDDPYENLMEADIRVTTLLSAGTAVDIPNLTTTILTVAVSSSQSNIQGFGRLRELPDKTRTPIFVYFVCEDIQKQVDYHEKKRALLQDRALSYEGIFIREPI